jgi:hypothetical protein
MIPYSSQRVIWYDNGSEVDVTRELNDYEAENLTFAYVASEDYLYIACDMPFNHKHFEMGTTKNAIASVASVQIWWANQWNDAVDVQDSTELAGASLAQSGIIRWSTNILKGWDKEQYSHDVMGITTTGLYNMYWARISWSASLTAGTTIGYLGHKFCNDEQLATEYPNTRNSSLKTAFAAGKTDWNDQHFAAAEDIVQDLQNGNVIISGNQIVDPEYYMEAAKHKAAMLIYAGLEGEGYQEVYKNAANNYNKSIKKKRYRVDIDRDGRLGEAEKHVITSFMTR